MPDLAIEPAAGLALDGRLAQPTEEELVAAAGWMSLQLHQFMVSSSVPGAGSPAAWLRAGDVDRVLAAIRDEPPPKPGPR